MLVFLFEIMKKKAYVFVQNMSKIKIIKFTHVEYITCKNNFEIKIRIARFAIFYIF